MIENGFIAAIGIIWLLCRFPLKRVAGVRRTLDILISGGLAWAFTGTYGGLVTGLLAGVIVSLFLTAIAKTAGVERLRLTRYEDERYPRFRWRDEEK